MAEPLSEVALELEAIFPAVLERLFLTPDDPLGDMPLVQLKVVRALQAGPSTTSSLAVRFHMSKPAVSQIVRRLVNAGMVDQTRSGHDGRIKTIALTPLALSLLQERSRARASQASRTLATLPPNEVQKLMELLRRCAHTEAAVSVAS